MVSPAQQKTAVAHVVAQRLCSVRRACRYLGMARSPYRYTPKPVPNRREQLYQRVIALSCHHPPHDLRHTFVTRLLDLSVPIEQVNYLAGHKSMAMTKRYDHS